MKLGRNDPCWCGSGRKYKRCHLKRDKEIPITTQDVVIALKDALEKQKRCLHPSASPSTCSGEVIRAHTIQRGGSLNRIAQNNHIYCFIPDYPSMARNSGQIAPKLIGLRSASTITGFCSFHDNKTFEKIEKHPIGDDIEQHFLLGYRAICRETFFKRAAIDMLPFQQQLDRGKTEFEQLQLQMLLKDWEVGARAGLREVERYKTTLDSMLLQEDYSKIAFYAFRFDSIPEVMCSGAYAPEFDFQGVQLQDLSDISRPLDYLSFSLVATGSGGIATFMWLRDSIAGYKLVQSLHSLEDSQIPHAIIRFVFEFFENNYFSPKWWHKLPAKVQKRISERAMSGVDAEVTRDPHCLVDDGMRAVDWKVISRITNERF